MDTLRFVELTLVHFILFSNITDGFKPEQIHIAWGESPLEVVITWNTKTVTPNAFVEYGVKSIERKQEGETKVFIDGGKRKRKIFIHRVRLKNLEPSQHYVYKCGSTFGRSEEFWFNSVPNGTNWSPKLVIFGDMGVKNAVSLPVLKNEAQSRSFDTFIHVGDFAYDMKDKNGLKGDEFMRDIQPIAAHVPYMVCPGNHENAYNFSHYRERFTMPGENENLFYSFNLGPAHFISVNTESFYYLEYGMKVLVNMYNWLEQDLKVADSPKNRQIRPWIITYGHRPMYCSNTNHGCELNDSRVRKGLNDKLFGLEDLFYRYGVDISLWGHEHSYERMWPVYNSTIKINNEKEPYVDPGAPIHITTGSAGCWEEIANFTTYPPPWSAKRLQSYGYTTMHIHNASHLYLQEIAIDEGQHVVDDLWIVKHKHRYNSK